MHLSLADHLLSEIAAKTIQNKQEAVDWFTWLWCYRRLTQNPNYYNMQGTSHRHMSDYLSGLIEDTLATLEQAKCIAIEDEMDLSALNLGLIASFYQVSSITLDTFSMSLTEKTKLKGLLEIVSSAVEFEDIPIRHHEDLILRKIYDRVPVKLSSVDFQSPNFKTNVLLQAHFSRIQLTADLASDQLLILERVVKLLSACVDVMSSEGYINALKAMDMTQMVIQAVWDSDSHLKQIPHFSSAVTQRCTEAEVTSVYDVTDLDDEPRDKLLQMDARQMRDVARFCNAYPSIEIEHEIQDADNLNASNAIKLSVTLARDEEGEEEDHTVVAPFYPGKKTENWWVVVGEAERTKTLLSIKKVPLQQKANVNLEFQLPKGAHKLTLSVVCDSYIGCDREFAIDVNVAEGEDSDDDDDDDDDEDVEMGTA